MRMMVSLPSEPELVKNTFGKPGASLAEHFRQLDRRHRRGLEKRVIERQLDHLLVSGIGDFPPPIADGNIPQAGKSVQDPPPGRVVQPHALAAHDDARAFGVQRRHVRIGMEMMPARRAPAARPGW